MPLAKGKKLTDVLGIAQGHKGNYVIHCARTNTRGDNPLDVFKAGRSRWQIWNSNARINNPLRDKNHILSLALLDRPNDLWLFCCVYEVMGKGWREDHGKTKRWFYETRSLALGKGYSGKLVVRFPYRYRNMHINLLDVGKGQTQSWDELMVVTQIRTKYQRWNW